MPRYVLYAYVDGYDLHDVAAAIEQRLRQFIEAGPWRLDRPWLVNDRTEDDPSLSPGDLPAWNLGLNVNLPDPASAPANWVDDVERIVRFLGRLHEETGRAFAVGVADTTRSWFSEDLMFVDDGSPDVSDLRRILGGGGGTPGRRT